MIPSKCIEVAKRLSAQDTDAVLAAIKSYQDLEVPIAKAQVKAVEDVLAQLEAERASLIESVKERYPDVAIQEQAAPAEEALAPEEPAVEEAPEKPASPVAGEKLSADQVKRLAERAAEKLQRDGFKTITEARAWGGEIVDAELGAGTARAKQLDEAIELGIVLAARKLIFQMRARDATDREIYGAMRELYGRQPNLGVRTSTSMIQQAYSTPVPLAFLASRLAGITDQSRVLEPTAGNGMLLIEANPDETVANELNQDRESALKAQGFTTTRIDATALPTMEPVDVVIANPPFGYVKDESRNREWKIDQQYTTNQIDHAIAMKALEAMKDDGRAVLIVAAPREGQEDGYKSAAKRAFYFTLYRDYNVVDQFTVSGDLYAKQGAAWPVDVIVIRGRGRSELKLPQAEAPRIYKSWDALQEKLDVRYAERGAGNRRQGEGAARGELDAGARDEARPVAPSDVGPAAVERGPGGPGPVRSGPVRGQPGAAGPAEGARAEGGERGERGQPRGAGEQADVGQIFDEEFAKLFGDLEKAPKRTAGEAATSAARETGAGIEDIAKGLEQLFGAKGRLGVGLQFDEETYAKAKPFFIAAIKHFHQAGQDIREAIRLLLIYLREKQAMTAEQIHGMKLYVERFMEDVRAGKIPEMLQSRAPVRPRALETEHQVAYEPASGVDAIGTLVPVNMKDSIAGSLDALKEKVGDLDLYVAKELDYAPAKLGSYFNAEQVDALAQALDAMKGGAGYIIGDATGVGKGRVVAGVIRWAQKNGKIPIFVTEKPNLYKDIYRDLSDIGMPDVNPVMTNAGESIPLTDDGSVVLKAKSGKDHNAHLQELVANGSLGDYDVIFTTYSQMQTIKGGQRTARMDFLEAFSRGGVVIFDESHNAGGNVQSEDARLGGTAKPRLTRADFARGIARMAESVFYSSATYAKRPEVMDLYFKTDMGLAVENSAALPAAIRAGGVPLQQVVAAMLAKTGQYIRRERSFAGVTYNTEVTPVNRQVAERMSSVMRRVAEFDQLKAGALKALKKNVRAEAKTMTQDGSIGLAGVHSTNFTSIMHNMVDQMLLALKVVPAAQKALEAVKRGEKPVLTVANTMGSFIEHYVEDHGLNTGDAVDISFRDLLLRYLERSRDVIIGNAFGKKTRHRLSDDELGLFATQAWDSIKKDILQSDFSDIPLSPIDYLKAQVVKAGLSFGEITGRQHLIDYTGDVPAYRLRPGREISIRGRNETIMGFNSGKLDVLLINQAGATGLSLHASEKFKDQRRRHMVIVQAERNIDTHMQMLGRVHRTGQVIEPIYTQIVADIPAEKRPAAILAKKMASLNANTTAARGSAVTSKEVVDFMNEYGDEVAAQLMEDNQDWHRKMGSPLNNDESGSGLEREEAIRKLTGRIPLLTIAEQETLYDLIESEYLALIDEKDRMGENALEAKTLPLEAKVKKVVQVTQGRGGTSPFAQGAHGEIVDVKKLGKSYTSDELVDRIRLSLQAPEGTRLTELKSLGAQRVNATRDELESEFKDFLQQELDGLHDQRHREATQTRLDAAHTRLDAILAQSGIGRPVVLTTRYGKIPAVVTMIDKKGKPKNPAALGAWKITYAVADAIRHVTLPASRLVTANRAPESAVDTGLVVIYEFNPAEFEGKRILQLFDEAQTVSREDRVIITGNLLAGFGKFPNGRIINYTTDEGTIRQGILMPAKFDVDKALNELPVEFPDAATAIGFLESLDGKPVVESVDEKVFRVAKLPGEDIYRISVAAARERGGIIYLHPKVLEAAGTDFVKAGSSMRVELPKAQAIATLQAILHHASQRVHTQAFRQEATDFLKGRAPKFEALDIRGVTLAERLGTPEPQRVSALQRLRRLEKRLDEDKITEQEFVAGARDLLAALEKRREAREEAEAGRADRVRGLDYVRERLHRARRTGNLTEGQVDFAMWLLDQAPHIATDLGVSIRTSKDDSGVAGRYLAFTRVAVLFGNAWNQETAAHEILHHTERMMPGDVQAGIIREWWKRVSEGLAKARKADDRKMIDFWSDVVDSYIGGNPEAAERLKKTLVDGDLPYSFYQYVNPSEFWAVNATSIMAGRYGAKTWIASAKQWLRQLIEKAKAVFGLASDAPVLRALEAVLEGTGERLSRDMLAAEQNQHLDIARGTAATTETPQERMERDVGPVTKLLRLPFKAARYGKGVIWAEGLLSQLNEKLTEKSVAWESIRAGLVDKYGLDEAYKRLRLRAPINMQKWARGILELRDKISGLSRNQANVVNRWMQAYTEEDLAAMPFETADRLRKQQRVMDAVTEKAFEDLPPAEQQTLRDVRELIASLGQEMVDLGILSQEVYDRNKLAYLHRSYLQHELAETPVGRLGTKNRLALWGETLKGRGIKDWRTFEELSKMAGEALPAEMKGKFFRRFELRAKVPEDVAGNLAALGDRQPLGRLRKVVYVPEDKPVPSQYAGWKDDGIWEVRWLHGGKYGLWRDLSRDEQTALGVIDDVRFNVVKTLFLMTHDVEIARTQHDVARMYGKDRLGPGERKVTAKEAQGMDWLAVYRKNVWVQVPETKIEGTNTQRYGALAGKFIPGPIWNDIRQNVALGARPSGVAGKLFEDAMRFWKITHTALSPTVHTNNVMANVLLSYVQDYRAKDLVKAIRVMFDAKVMPALYKEMGRPYEADKDNADLYRRFEDSGATLGLCAYHELKKEALQPMLHEMQKTMLDEIQAEALNNEQAALLRALSMISMMNRLTQGGKVAKKWGWDVPIEIYQFEDEVFRLSAFIKANRAGLEDFEAGAIAKEAFLDYDINAPWIQAMRRTGWPFIAFSYRAIPKLIKLAVEQPWKLVAVWGSAEILNNLTYAMLGLGDEDEDKERKRLPPEKQGKIWGMFPKLFRAPWGSEADFGAAFDRMLAGDTDGFQRALRKGDPVFLDVRRFYPAGDVFDIYQGHAALPLPAPLMPGGPVAMFAELFADSKNFTGERITEWQKRFSSPSEMTWAEAQEEAARVGAAFLDYSWKFWMPNNPLLYGTWSFDAIRGTGGFNWLGLEPESGHATDVLGRELSLAQAILSSVGWKLATYPKDIADINISFDLSRAVAEFNKNQATLAWQLKKNKISRRQYDEEIAYLMRRLKRAKREHDTRKGESPEAP